ncbi:MAG TPA: hypothetical protein VH500_11975 [Nitrososphaeraceae archaeon]
MISTEPHKTYFFIVFLAIFLKFWNNEEYEDDRWMTRSSSILSTIKLSKSDLAI